VPLTTSGHRHTHPSVSVALTRTHGLQLFHRKPTGPNFTISVTTTGAKVFVLAALAAKPPHVAADSLLLYELSAPGALF